jgi:hypothetical protein
MFLKLRVSLDEAERFNQRAAALGVTVSQLIRDTALHGAVSSPLKNLRPDMNFADWAPCSNTCTQPEIAAGRQKTEKNGGR